MKSKNKRTKRSTILANEGGYFTMPGGFKVTVNILGKDEAREEMGSQVLAQYWQDEHLILLKRARTKKQRKADLEHELSHMTIDWVDHFVRKAKI